ncbi:hypothetical protein [Lentzea sp. E54]|uniref:hypothetical protein n=1 Tax=Lentzea xerophila TaxID=3435883 RepID=UPI003DA3088F
MEKLRPRLKSDVLYVPIDGGVHVFGAGADVALHGGGAYAWLDRIAPYLDGSRELGELVGALPADKADAVTAIVRRLAEAGCVVDATEDEPHGLTARELETYSSEIAFLDYYGASAARRFERYRNTPVTVFGSGPVFVSLVASVLRSGVRTVRAAISPEGVTDTGRLSTLVDEALSHDPAQRFDLVERPEIGASDVVLHVAEEGALERALLLDERCREAGATLVQGYVLGDVAWLGPVGDGWLSAFRRVAATPAPNRFLTGPAAAVVAAHLGTLALRVLTGVVRREDTELTRIDLETLRTSTHPVLPVVSPAPESHEAFARRVDGLLRARASTPEEFSERAAACFDRHAGVIRDLDEQDFTQIPLNVTEALLPEPGTQRVFGAALGFREARAKAALRALAVHSADPRRGTGATVPAVTLLPGEHGISLGEVVELPAATVFSVDTGLAAGLSWADALADGLGQHCARVAVEDVRAGRVRPVPVDLGDHRSGLPALVVAAGGRLRVADVGAALGLPVLAWWQGAEVVAVTCGPDAVLDGLTAVALDSQGALTGEQDYRPVPITGVPAPEGTPVPARAATAAEMLKALRDRGFRPVAVPLDHDSVVHELVPGILRVLVGTP